MASSGCLTCAKSIECDDPSIRIADNKEVQNALGKHFWFDEQQYLKSDLCCPCWHKIEDFHRFYCEVEEIHSQPMYAHMQLVEVKQESFLPEPEQSMNVEDVEDSDDEPIAIKREPPNNDEMVEENDVLSDINQSQKHTRTRKEVLTKVNEYVSKHLTLNCDTCSQRYETFEALQKHSMMEHTKAATVLCCRLKFTNSYRFMDHIRFHLDPNYFKCTQCTHPLRTREALYKHIQSAHGSSLQEEQPSSSGKEDDESCDDFKKENTDEEASGEDMQEDGDYTLEKDDDSESESSSSGDEANDDGNEKGSVKKRRRRKTSKEDVAAIQQFVTENVRLECGTCSERYPTFKELQKHSRTEHKKLTEVACCDRKFTARYRFDDHVMYHLDPDRFQCSECLKKCPNQLALNKHKKKVHTPDDEKRHQCKVCHKKFATSDALGRHLKTHKPSEQTPARARRLYTHDVNNEKLITDNINLECDTCQQKHTTFLALQKHSMQQHNKLSYVFCCDQKFNKKPRLIDHVLFHLDPTRFQCKVCLKNLPHTESLKRHMEKKHAPEEAKTIKCSMCPKMFTHQKFLRTHERYHNRSWHCEICDKKFICEATLKSHHKSVHTKELNYVCHVCARIFHIYSSYRSHLETHEETPKKKPQKAPVQCTICNTWTIKMSKHMRLHSGPQTCEVCGKECKNQITYWYHMRNHRTGDFICSVCGKGFKSATTLKEHTASHTGDVLYSCDFCERTFNSNANRASHRKKMHPQQWLEDKIKKEEARKAKSRAMTAPAQDGSVSLSGTTPV